MDEKTLTTEQVKTLRIATAVSLAAFRLVDDLNHIGGGESNPVHCDILAILEEIEWLLAFSQPVHSHAVKKRMEIIIELKKGIAKP